MKTRLEYIDSEVQKIEELKFIKDQDYRKYMADANEHISKIKNISEEDYKKIIDFEVRTNEEFELMLSETGVTVEDFDNGDFDSSTFLELPVHKRDRFLVLMDLRNKE